jgi:hypothetical protein
MILSGSAAGNVRKSYRTGKAIAVRISRILYEHMQWGLSPHGGRAADAYLRLGIITRVHPAIDFLLYGVDLIELLAIANVTLMIAARLNKK